MFRTSRKRTFERRLFDLEVLMAKSEKRFESFDKSIAETQDMVKRLHRADEDQTQDLSKKLYKKIDDLKTSVDRVLDETIVNMRIADVDLRRGLDNQRGHIDNLYSKFDNLEVRLSDLNTRTVELGKRLPASVSSSPAENKDALEGRDYGSKVKKLIEDALDTLSKSGDKQ